MRALQFVRRMAPDWHIDTQRIAATGASSGGCLSLWLARHADMARADSEDPVARESTRLCCVAVSQALSSVDPRFIGDLMPGSSVHEDFCRQFYGVDIGAADVLSVKMCQMAEELSPINHANHDVPPTLLRYDHRMAAPYGIHHPSFGLAFKERMDEVGASCDLMVGGQVLLDSTSKTISGFLKENLLG